MWVRNSSNRLVRENHSHSPQVQVHNNRNLFENFMENEQNPILPNPEGFQNNWGYNQFGQNNGGHNHFEQEEEDHRSDHGNFQAAQARPMRDYINPSWSSTPSCILLPVMAHGFVVRPGLIQHLPHTRLFL